MVETATAGFSLRAPRLLLRRWRKADSAPFAAISADPAVMAMLLPLADRAASDAWIADACAHWAAHGFGLFAVELPGEAPLIGAVGLHRAPFAAPFPPVEIAWRLARSYWGRGYATEAARAAIADGFTRLGLDEIVAYTVPHNLRSRRVMERLGMCRDPNDDFDHPRLPPGRALRRHVLYRLHRTRD